MEWVYIYILGWSGTFPSSVWEKDNYKTEQECQLAHGGRDENPFWCVPRNWLDEGQRRSVRAFVTD